MLELLRIVEARKGDAQAVFTEIVARRAGKYSGEPRLATIVLGTDKTDKLNHIVQIYAKDAIFYRFG